MGNGRKVPHYTCYLEFVRTAQRHRFPHGILILKELLREGLGENYSVRTCERSGNSAVNERNFKDVQNTLVCQKPLPHRDVGLSTHHDILGLPLSDPAGIFDTV